MVERIRQICQHLSFILFLYGGRIGIDLGSSLPCFACPYVNGCAGHCYLMVLQRSYVGFQTSFEMIFSSAFVNILWPFVLFLIFFMPISKIWCAWLCPFCLFQDWITMIRKKLNVRGITMTRQTRKKLKSIKYILLVLMILIPLSIANFGLHPDWKLPFCQICPARPILPMFVGDFDKFNINMTNGVTMGFSITAMLLTGIFLAGIFFKERFFCIFCPMLAFMHLFKKLSPVRFEKNAHACTGCGNCERMCPVDIPDVHLEKGKKDKSLSGDTLKPFDVLTQDCMGCMACVEACPEDNVLTFKWFNFKLFSSSRRYMTEKWSSK